VGVIREVDDGVANIEGLTDAMLNEMIDRGDAISGWRSTFKRPRPV
jgi:hypothetical protein